MLLKLILPASFYFFNEATRKCKITCYVVHIILLLDSITVWGRGHKDMVLDHRNLTSGGRGRLEKKKSQLGRVVNESLKTHHN